jgi:hypothetical protein
MGHAAVQNELQQILAHPTFKNSTRCLNFLRYVVEHSLRGDNEILKERTLGVEVFGRDAAYDNSQDPIVRSTASEVRKRLAQYYMESAHHHEVRIQLNAGSYVPEFQFLTSIPETQAPPTVEKEVVSPVAASIRPEAPKRLSIYIVVLAVAALLITAMVSLYGRAKTQMTKSAAGVTVPTSAEIFWYPIMAPANRVLVCVGLPQPQIMDNSADTTYIKLSEASMLSRLAAFFNAKGRALDLKNAKSVSFADIQHSPTIVLGGWSNPWMIGSVEKQRYYFGHQPGTTLHWIEDRQHPSNRKWIVDTSVHPSKLERDYAIIIRIPDAEAGHPRVYIGGLGENGTIAAMDCVMDTKCIETLASHAPKDWMSQNGVEWVIAIPMISGSPDSPQVLDVTEMSKE